MEPCPRCGRAEMANVTHPCTPQVTILGPAFGVPIGPPIDVPSIMRAGGFEEGVRVERSRIVAWLRGAMGSSLLASRGHLADAIEKGEHEGVPVVADAAPPMRPIRNETTEKE